MGEHAGEGGFGTCDVEDCKAPAVVVHVGESGDLWACAEHAYSGSPVSPPEGGPMPGDRPNPTELLEGTTPGPWYHDGSAVYSNQGTGVEWDDLGVWSADDRPTTPDLDLIAAAPDLAAALAAQDREVARLREAIQNARDAIGGQRPGASFRDRELDRYLSPLWAALSPEVETPEPAGEPTP